jgi:hypothetical protein
MITHTTSSDSTGTNALAKQPFEVEHICEARAISELEFPMAGYGVFFNAQGDLSSPAISSH